MLFRSWVRYIHPNHCRRGRQVRGRKYTPLPVLVVPLLVGLFYEVQLADKVVESCGDSSVLHRNGFPLNSCSDYLGIGIGQVLPHRVGKCAKCIYLSM